MVVDDLGMIQWKIRAGLLQGLGTQLIPEMVQDLPGKKVSFAFGTFSDQQALFLRQRKTGTLLGLSVQIEQLGGGAVGGKNTGIIQL